MSLCVHVLCMSENENFRLVDKFASIYTLTKYHIHRAHSAVTFAYHAVGGALPCEFRSTGRQYLATENYCITSAIW